MISLNKVTMTKIKNRHSFLKGLVSFVFIAGILGQAVFSEDLGSQKLSDSHGHSHDVENKQPIGKPSASINIDYAVPENITVGQETRISVVLNSMVNTPGVLLLQYKADAGLNIVGSGSVSLDFIGDEISTDILFSADVDGLYYLNLGVMQLDDNNQRIQARSFVVPIQVGSAQLNGEMSSTQNKASKQSVKAGSENIIEMIAE